MSPSNEKNIKFPIFSERFRQLRGHKSQADFADLIGISRPTIGFYENGERLPDALVIAKICEKCNVSSDWLLGLSDVMAQSVSVQTINKQLGLSELSIENLQELCENYDGKYLIPTINLLIEMATPPPEINDYANGYSDDYFVDEDAYEEDLNTWENKYINVLRSIEDYMQVDLSYKGLSRILDTGEIKSPQENKKPFYLNTLQTIDTTKIVEKVLLDDISDRLKKIKHLQSR